MKTLPFSFSSTNVSSRFNAYSNPLQYSHLQYTHQIGSLDELFNIFAGVIDDLFILSSDVLVEQSLTEVAMTRFLAIPENQGMMK